jgi:hypothetical protein
VGVRVIEGVGVIVNVIVRLGVADAGAGEFVGDASATVAGWAGTGVSLAGIAVAGAPVAVSVNTGVADGGTLVPVDVAVAPVGEAIVGGASVAEGRMASVGTVTTVCGAQAASRTRRSPAAISEWFGRMGFSIARLNAISRYNPFRVARRSRDSDD